MKMQVAGAGGLLGRHLLIEGRKGWRMYTFCAVKQLAQIQLLALNLGYGRRGPLMLKDFHGIVCANSQPTHGSDRARFCPHACTATQTSCKE